MVKKVVLFLWIFFVTINGIPHAQGANIVFFFGFSTYSHRVPAWPLVTALASRGHNVSFVSPYPAKHPHPKVRNFVPQSLKEWVESWEEDPFDERQKGNLLKGWMTLPDAGIDMCELIYQDVEYVNWMKSSKVDLVFIDTLFNDCAYGMAHYWKAKTIKFATTTVFTWHIDPFGIPDETNWIPSMELFYPADMSFGQRLTNALTPVAWDVYRKWKYFPRLEQITRESLNVTDFPKFEELERNLSLIFLNTHYSEEFARALPPSVIPIGGIGWVEKTVKSLPADLETFLNSGTGFIYVSFGTFADFNNLGADIKQAFVGAIKAFPNVQFVWKHSNVSISDEFPAKNVYIKKWMPQQEILSHPKIKAFLTHSGLLSTQEALTGGVPLICFPIFGDQDYNAERVHRREYGIRLEINSLKQLELEDSISKILTDLKYRKNANKVSALFKDRQQKPLDVALWWTEFVLRHDQEILNALKPSSVNQPWWMKRQLDVWFTIAGSLLSVLLLSVYILTKICLKVLSNKSKTCSTLNENEKIKIH